MKPVFFGILFSLAFINCQSASAQYNDPQVMASIGANISGVTGYAPMVTTPYASMRLGDAAFMQAQGNFLLNQSQANMNNESAYSMRLNNQLLRTRTFFENRQLNRFYRDLEDWQKEERMALKRAGIYNREAIEYLYGIRR